MAQWDSDTRVAPQNPAVLFADLSGSTELYEKHGDVEAKGTIDSLFVELRRIVESTRGWWIKTIGDELMCLFDSPGDAARASIAMQRFLHMRNRTELTKLFLRVGFHCGSVIVENNDVFGDTVNTAARIAGVSLTERILLSRVAAEQLPEDLAKLVQPWRSQAFKGKEAEFEVVELIWRPRRLRTFVAGAAARQLVRLTVRCQGRTAILDPGGKSIRFGRSEANDLVIDDPEAYVSGSHGQIEIRGGRPVLSDSSRNGIYIAFGSEQFFLLEDKSIVLRDSGRMTLGRPPHEAGAILAEFRLE